MTIILAHYKTTGKIQPYKNLTAFCDHNKEYKYNTLANHITRKKQPFENMHIRVEKVPVIGKVSKILKQEKL